MRKFGVRDQLGYVMGDMGGSFVNLYVDAFFLTFCTYVLGISPFFMGTLFLCSRLWDAINDPIIGSFPDRWLIGKSGNRFKPYIKIAMIPLAIAGVLCFMDVSSLSDKAKHIWVCVTYIMYGMSYTGTSMPFGSMAAVITNDPIERTKLSRARGIGGPLVAYGALSIVPMVAFDSAGNVVPSGFLKLAAVFGVLCIAFYIGLLTLTTERIRTAPKSTTVDAPKERYNYRKVLLGVLRNRPLIGVMVATVGSMLYISANGTLNTYLYKEFYQAPQLLTYFSLSNLPLIALAFPLIPWLTSKFSKRNIILVSAAYNLVFGLILMLVPISNPMLYMVLAILSNAGQTSFVMLIWALVTDCLDYGEYITGARNDGSTYSIYTFSRKIGSTLASTIASYALGWIGYVSGSAVQAAGVADSIRLLATAVPVITCVLELVGIGLIFNLTKEKSADIYRHLAEKRLAQKNTENLTEQQVL